MITYKLCPIAKQNTESKAVLRFNENGSITSIPFDPANTDYQAYLKWLEEGGVPEPADEVASE
jgi:hypothetical protein